MLGTRIIFLSFQNDDWWQLVGRHCEITDKWLTQGARNEIHICDSNMNDSYEQEIISRHEVLLSRKNPAYLLYNTGKLKGIAFKVVPISQLAGWAARFVNGCLKKLCHKTEWLRASIAFKVIQIPQWAGWAARFVNGYLKKLCHKTEWLRASIAF